MSTTEANKDVEQFELDEEIAVKEKLNPSADSASPSKVKFIAANDSKNGEAKIDVDRGYGGSVGMSKQELLKYANDPFWVRLRLFLFILFWVIWFAMLIGAVVIIALAPKCSVTSSLNWWQKTTAYQVYVRSFSDSNGDGEGDIRGVVNKLDYFKDLGVETLILSPIYPSEMKDLGYDVTDYTDIDPRYGTLEDFDQLVDEMHNENRNMKVIIDFIPNHTSDRHKWFTESIAGDEKYKDFYVWRNGSSSGPPNNWKSVFGGSAWTYHPLRQQYYLHQFFPQQPDLNLRNPEVRQALKDVLNFWLSRKVDGIRIDAVSHLFEDENFEDEAIVKTQQFGNDYETLSHNKTKAQNENFDILKEWRQIVKKFGLNKIIITEAYEEPEQLVRYYGSADDPIVDLPFQLDLVGLTLTANANQLRTKIESWNKAIDSLNWVKSSKSIGPWSAWVTGNHDKPRLVSRLGTRLSDAFLILVFTIGRNTPVVYYGDEIGMQDNSDVPNAAKNEGDSSRFAFRSPMQWNANTSAGFSNSTDNWVNVHNSYKDFNVETELSGDKNSHLKLFKALVELRKKSEQTILLGETQFPETGTAENILLMSRTLDGENGYLLAINFNTALEQKIQLNETYLPETGTIYLTDSQSSTNLIGQEITFSSFTLQPSQSILVEFPNK